MIKIFICWYATTPFTTHHGDGTFTHGTSDKLTEEVIEDLRIYVKKRVEEHLQTKLTGFSFLSLTRLDG